MLEIFHFQCKHNLNFLDADANDKPSSAVTKIKEAAKLAISTDQMTKAKEFVAAGGTLEAIQSKYKLTKAQEKSLLNEYKAANIKAA